MDEAKVQLTYRVADLEKQLREARLELDGVEPFDEVKCRELVIEALRDWMGRPPIDQGYVIQELEAIMDTDCELASSRAANLLLLLTRFGGTVLKALGAEEGS